MRSLATIGLAASIALLPACVVVVDNDHDGMHEQYVQDDTPRIGVELTRPSSATASQTGVDPARTCMISRVVIDSPAARAGLQKYDIVTAIDGRDYATVSALREAVRSRKPGEILTLTVIRGGKSEQVPVTVGDY